MPPPIIPWRYDYDHDGKLSRRELEIVKTQVASFINLGPENFPERKVYVRPLLTKNFPSVDVLLKKYDLNHDGALDVTELKAFARDIPKQ